MTGLYVCIRWTKSCHCLKRCHDVTACIGHVLCLKICDGGMMPYTMKVVWLILVLPLFEPLLYQALHFPLNLFIICDIINEKVPYCRTNSVILDQLFSYFCDIIFYQNYTWSDKNVFFRCSWASNILGPNHYYAHYAQRMIWAYDICSAIRYLLADDVTYIKQGT